MNARFLIRAAAASSLAKLNAHYGTDFCLPPMEFSNRISNSLGQYRTSMSASGSVSGVLRFYLKYFTHDQQAFLNEVVPHEVAHFFVHRHFLNNKFVRSANPHGDNWKSVMAVLGVPARAVTPDFKAVTNRVAYSCACKGRVLNVSKIVHNRIQRGLTYRCSRCRDEIRVK